MGDRAADCSASSASIPIRSDRLRDIVAAYSDMARPTAIYLAGIAVFVAVLHNPTWDVAAIAAGVVTGISFLRSQDKQAEIGSRQ